MADIENVINAMEHCKKYGTLGGHDCSGLFEYTIDLRSIINATEHRSDCPYGKCPTCCVVTLVSDAIALLKEYRGAKTLIDEISGQVHDCAKMFRRDDV